MSNLQIGERWVGPLTVRTERQDRAHRQRYLGSADVTSCRCDRLAGIRVRPGPPFSFGRKCRRKRVPTTELSLSEVFELALMAAAFVASAYLTWWASSGGAIRLREWQVWGLTNRRRETEDRLQFVFDNSIDGIMTFLPDGTILSGNPADRKSVV